MLWTNVDSIVRRSLLERGYPIHYYAEYLFHATTCLRQLNRDTLKLVNSANLPVDSATNSVTLPPDFMDDILVAIPVGDLLQPVSKKDNLNPIQIHDTTTGAFTSYSDLTTTQENTVFGFIGNWYWFWNISDYGEPTGRYFGAGGGEKLNGYMLIKEQNRIQLTGTFSSDNIVLLYISDGQSIDNATKVDAQAIDAVKAYINWMCSPNAAIERSPEGMTYYNQKRLLKASFNDLTVTDIKDIIRRNFMATIKN